jgi:hypothetical protein
VGKNEPTETAPARSWKRWAVWPILCGMFVVTGFLVLPLFVKPRVVVSRSACIANLKLIDGAKATWALEHHKQPGDEPAEADIFGPDQYIRVKPECPQGGTYTVGAIGENPRCTVPEHNRQFEENLARVIGR